jgi:hypothetical protein
MLHEFMRLNRDELIWRCRAKVSRRLAIPVNPAQQLHGIPIFIEQLIEALSRDGHTDHAPASAESSASLHGKELLRDGYTVDQVVHDYGDICQAVTELAAERNARVTVEEFHTLNRLLDTAIADAVTSYGHYRDQAMGRGALDLHEQLGALADEQRRLLDTALHALDALKTGNIGVLGATGTLLEDSLMKLRALNDRALPEIRLSTGMTTPTIV